MPAPLIQLLYVGLKRASKFVANRLQRRARKSLLFKTYICMPPAQSKLACLPLYNSFRINARSILDGKGKAKHVVRLGEPKAVELGSEILGELVIVSVASIIIYWEYSKSAVKEEMKYQARIQQDLIIERRLQEQGLMMEELHYQIRQLKRYIDDSRNAKSV